MIEHIGPFSRGPRKTIRLCEREVIDDINQPDMTSSEDIALEDLRQDLREVERSIYMIDKKYRFLRKRAWKRYYKLVEGIRDLENYKKQDDEKQGNE